MSAERDETASGRAITRPSGGGVSPIVGGSLVLARSALEGSFEIRLPDGDRPTFITGAVANSLPTFSAHQAPGSWLRGGMEVSDEDPSETRVIVTETIIKRQISVSQTGTLSRLMRADPRGASDSPVWASAAIIPQSEIEMPMREVSAAAMVKVSSVLKGGAVVVLVFAVFLIVGNTISAHVLAHPLIPIMLIMCSTTFYVMGAVYDRDRSIENGSGGL